MVRATRFSVPSERSKEGDVGLKPVDTRTDETDWPSLMIEVGYSEKAWNPSKVMPTGGLKAARGIPKWSLLSEFPKTHTSFGYSVGQ